DVETVGRRSCVRSGARATRERGATDYEFVVPRPVEHGHGTSAESLVGRSSDPTAWLRTLLTNTATPGLPHPWVVPQLRMRSGQHALQGSAPAVDPREPLVELHQDDPDARKPFRLGEPLEYVVLAALDVELQQIDVVQPKFPQNRGDVTDRHRSPLESRRVRTEIVLDARTASLKRQARRPVARAATVCAHRDSRMA